MAGMIQTYNHVGAALFRIEAASRLGAKQFIMHPTGMRMAPQQQNCTATEIKDMELCRNDYGKRGEAKGTINPSPKKYLTQ